MPGLPLEELSRSEDAADLSGGLQGRTKLKMQKPAGSWRTACPAGNGFNEHAETGIPDDPKDETESMGSQVPLESRSYGTRRDAGARLRFAGAV